MKVEVYLKPLPWEQQALLPLGLILLELLEHGTRSMGTIAIPKDSYRDRAYIQRFIQQVITAAENRAIGHV